MSIDSSLAKGLIKYNIKVLSERLEIACDKLASLRGLSRTGRYKKSIELTRQALGPCLCFESEIGKGSRRWWISISAAYEDTGELSASFFMLFFSDLKNPLHVPPSFSTSSHAVERLLQSLGKNDIGKISRVWLRHALSLSNLSKTFYQTSSGPRQITCTEEEMIIWRIRDDDEGLEACTVIRADRLDHYQAVYDKAKQDKLEGGFFIKESLSSILRNFINNDLHDQLFSEKNNKKVTEDGDAVELSEEDSEKYSFHIF